ncbi:hypothetical protein BG015_002757 [Linnemannia schmuckeri]|uniref:Uncharacterized protein n=1 Tax=Linnemannia schmuckeri TaxID=64567 RepID=A0A9P5VDG5_9FUNG|nr:hypothetical protein BG015_002757 [Linnemannia schmuckeri]
MSGQSPLRRQVRLHAKPIIGGPTTTNNRIITGNLVSAAEQLQLKAQQLTGGGLTTANNNNRITGNLISAAEQLQLKAQQRLQKKPSSSPPQIGAANIGFDSQPDVSDLIAQQQPRYSSAVLEIADFPIIVFAIIHTLHVIVVADFVIAAFVAPSSNASAGSTTATAAQKTAEIAACTGSTIALPTALASLSPESSPEPKNNETTAKVATLPQHHSPREEMDRNEIDEWLPKFLTKGFDLSESWIGVHERSEDPLPKQQGPSAKGPLDNDGSQNAGLIQPRAMFSTAKTTSAEEHKKQEPSTPAAKVQKALPGKKKTAEGEKSPRTLGSLSMTSLHLFDNEPLTAAEFLSSSPIRAHFQNKYLKQTDQDKDQLPSPQTFEKHQHQRLRHHQRKKSQGQPWILIPRPHQTAATTTMHRSQSSLSQLSTTSTALYSPTTTSTSFAGGSNLLDYVSSDDPLGGLSIPRGPPPQIPPQPTDPFLRCFWVMRQLEQTMTTGGFLTRKVHVPREVWYQRASMIRLPAAEAKVSACHTITLMLEQMIAQSKRGMLNLMIGPPTPASSASSFGPLELIPNSSSTSRSGSRSSSSSSSIILPHSPSSPIAPSQAWFQSTTTTSTIATSVSATTALGSQTLTLTQPPTPTTPSQVAFSATSTLTSVTPTKPTKPAKSATRNSGDKEFSALPSYTAINTEQDRILLTKELEALESTALHIWSKLSKKLSFVHRPGKEFGSHTVTNGADAGNSGTIGTNATATTARQHQAQDLHSSQEHDAQDDKDKDKDNHDGHAVINAVGAGTDLKSHWKHFSKSVQKSMVNDKVDDTTTYTDSVLRLF